MRIQKANSVDDPGRWFAGCAKFPKKHCEYFRSLDAVVLKKCTLQQLGNLLIKNSNDISKKA